jgi:hypothetical protein
MLLTNINDLLELTEAVLPITNTSSVIKRPSGFKTQSQINRDVSDKIKSIKKSTSTISFKKEASKNALLKQNALRKDPILRKLESQREARLAKDGVKSNTVAV